MADRNSVPGKAPVDESGLAAKGTATAGRHKFASARVEGEKLKPREGGAGYDGVVTKYRYQDVEDRSNAVIDVTVEDGEGGESVETVWFTLDGGRQELQLKALILALGTPREMFTQEHSQEDIEAYIRGKAIELIPRTYTPKPGQRNAGIEQIAYNLKAKASEATPSARLQAANRNLD